MPDVCMRPASIEDTSQLEALMSAYYHGISGVSMDDFVVAEKEGTVIAACAITHDKFCELHSIAVLPEHRGKGLGTELFRFIMEKNEDLRNVYVRTTIPIFFSKLGFRELEAGTKVELWDDCAVCDRLGRCRQSVMFFASDNDKS